MLLSNSKLAFDQIYSKSRLELGVAFNITGVCCLQKNAPPPPTPATAPLLGASF